MSSEPEALPPEPVPVPADSGGASSWSGLRVLGFVLLALGVILVAIGAVYLAIHANQLPSFLGKIPGKRGISVRYKRGYAGLIGGAVCLAVSGFLLTRRRKTGAKGSAA